jgi:hypothetical protein
VTYFMRISSVVGHNTCMCQQVILAKPVSCIVLTGEHVSTDAMFRLGSRTVGGGTKCYVFAMGDRHNICRFWGLDGDTDEALLPGLRKWATQLKRQQYYDKGSKTYVNALEAIRYWHDDRCCRTSDPSKHPYMSIFPNLTRVRVE